MAFVYRCRDADGRVIYVGRTRQATVAQRLRQHERTAPWWPHVASVDWSTFATVDHAKASEAHHIHALHPRFNLHCGMCPHGQRVQDRYSSVTSSSESHPARSA